MISKSITIGEIHQSLLKQLQEAWCEVLACHADLEHINPASKEFKKAQERLADVEKDLWKFKDLCAWARCL